MAYTVTVYFLGKFRPAYFTGAHLHDVLETVSEALINCDRETRNALYGYMIAAEVEMTKKNPPARFSVEHGAKGLCIETDGSIPMWLTYAIQRLPPCPGMDYSRAETLPAEPAL